MCEAGDRLVSLPQDVHTILCTVTTDSYRPSCPLPTLLVPSVMESWDRRVPVQTRHPRRSNDHRDGEMSFLGRIQRLLLVSGVLLIGFYVGAYIHREILYQAALRQFQEPPAKPRIDKPDGHLPEITQKVDFTLWSEKRIAAYEQSLLEHFDPPLAVLKIHKVSLEVPVLEGTGDLTLNRGVGHISGTSRPGEEGNIGIAGHRDGFFRVLRDVGPGDRIELLTAGRRDIYTVDRIVLVSPSDVSVLQPRAGQSLTLVTCYPFYFVGSAPKRYIVEASLKDSEVSLISDGRTNKPAISE